MAAAMLSAHCSVALQVTDPAYSESHPVEFKTTGQAAAEEAWCPVHRKLAISDGEWFQHSVALWGHCEPAVKNFDIA